MLRKQTIRRRRSKPVNPRIFQQRVVLLLCIIMSAIALILTQDLRQPVPVPEDGEVRVHFIDVGQGDSILVQSADHAVLIDAGIPAAGQTVAAYLDFLGISVLDYVVATHPHNDHIGGMPVILDRFEVRELWMPDTTHDTAAFENFLDAIHRNDLEITTVQAGDILSAGLIHMVAVAPSRSGYANRNDYSIVLHMQYGDTSFLFTGDAEALSENEMMASGRRLQADVLKVGHHGSRTSTTDSFLDAVNPFAVVITVSADNQFGHPHQDILNRLADRNIRVLRTDEMGTIVMVTDGLEIYLYE